MKRLSKSRYMLFCQCPKALWLKVNKPDEAAADAGVEARFENGNEVGDLAMGLFGPYVEVTTKKEDGSLDLSAMINRTKQEMERGTDVICEASFALDSHYCAVDILRKTKDGWAIYEVKSSSFPDFEGQVARLEKYAPDIAYQKWVLTQCGINVTGTYLVCLNSDYVRQGELDIQKLFVTVDMHELVENEYLKVSAQVSQALKMMAKEDDPNFDLSERCMKPYGCAFLDYCKRQHGVPKDEPTVFDLYRMHIDKDGIREFLSKLAYPLYFLDFETIQQVVPLYDGTKPYQQITFQYSLHIYNEETAKVERGRLKFTRTISNTTQKEFLAPNDGSDPRRPLAEQLCKDIPMNACTLAYNKMFECGRIRELAAMYPDLSDHLLNIADHIVDLIEPFRAGHYYMPAMGGSFSIKSVLPALFPDEPSLDYHNLDERCQNGGNAMFLFPKLVEMQKRLPKQGMQQLEDGCLAICDSLMKLSDILAIQQEISASRKALLRYCELDTWAMVKVWEKLKEVTE